MVPLLLLDWCLQPLRLRFRRSSIGRRAEPHFFHRRSVRHVAAYSPLYPIEPADAEYVLSTFTNTGLAPRDEDATQQFLWHHGSIGEMVLEAFDRLRHS